MSFNPQVPLYEDQPSQHAPVAPMAPDAELARLGDKLPRGVYLGASSWNFPGWRDIVYSPMSGERSLARYGLSAYSRHPVLRTVGIDKGFYKAISEAEFAFFAEQVPEAFRFLVKAPQSVSDCVLRDRFGRATDRNRQFLSTALAVDTFIEPALKGLGEKAGPLVFEMPPIPRQLIRESAEQHAFIDRMAAFFDALPKRTCGANPLYCVEMRTAQLLTPRFVKAIRETGVRLVIGIHPSLPPVQRQIAALRAFDEAGERESGWMPQGDVIVRWSLSTFGGNYRQLKADWSPFNEIHARDAVTRSGLAWLAGRAVAAGRRFFAVANNKAEGCAPVTMRELAAMIVENDIKSRERQADRPLSGQD